jgi:hypothetical protein
MEYLTGPEKMRIRQNNRLLAMDRVLKQRRAQDAADVASLGSVVARLAVGPVMNPLILTDRVVERLTGVSLSGHLVTNSIAAVAKSYNTRRAFGGIFRKRS